MPPCDRADLLAERHGVGRSDAGVAGSLVERGWRGTRPVALPGGEQRVFLENDDEILIRGYCERPGAIRIGFGECRGRVARRQLNAKSAATSRPQLPGRTRSRWPRRILVSGRLFQRCNVSAVTFHSVATAPSASPR